MTVEEAKAKLLHEVGSLPGWCTPEKASRIFELVREHKPTHQCVELGVFGGRSLLAIAFGLQCNGMGHVVGLDTYSFEADCEGKLDPAHLEYWRTMNYGKIESEARQALLRHNLGVYAEIKKAHSLQIVHEFLDGEVSLLHQDSNHSEEVSVDEVRAWLPKLQVGGWWIQDDFDWPTIRVSSWLLRQSGCELIEEHPTPTPQAPRGQWAVFRKVK